MKIKRTKITAATSSVKIPAPFDKYYRLMSDEEFEDYTGGYPAHPSPCEEAEGYNAKHFSYVIAKPEYEDFLANNGLDIAELVTSDWDKNKLMIAYVVNDRVYPVDESDMPEEEIEASVDSYDDDEIEYDEIYDEEDLYDRDTVMQAIKDEFGIDDYDAYTIYDWYDAEGAQDDFNSIADLIDYIRDDIYDMLDACDDELQADRIREAIESCTQVTSCDSVKASVDTGLEYWYFTRHGLGPGMLPKGVNVIDVIDDGWDTYVLVDKMLTTEELNQYDLKEKCPPEELMACDTVTAAEEGPRARKVSEDKDSIHYVVASDDDPDWIVDYKIPDDPDYVEREERKRIARELADEADYYDRLHGEGDYEGDPHDVYGAEELEEEEEDFLNQPDQEFKSDKTAVNGKQGKLPAVFKKANIPNGALVLDYGGGTPESEAVAQAYLDQFEAREMLYDPFNQTPEHNRQVVKDLKSNGGADVAVCSNVLNVIKEQEVRLDLLNKIKKLLKSGATAYISVYEGSGAGEGSATQNNESFQNNRKLSGYLEEVQSVFPDATKKGAVIIAPNTSSAKKEVESTTDIASIDLVQLEEDIKAGCEEYLTSEEGGFSPSGTPKQSQWDMNADEIYIVEVNPEPEENRIQVEVRAELGYSGMMRMSEVLDKIIEQYDPDAYFDMVTSGIMDAYIYDNSIKGSTAIEGARFDKWNDEMVNRHDRDFIDPPDDDEDEEVEEREDEVVDFDFDYVVNVDENGDWEESKDDPSNLDDASSENDLVPVDDIIQDATDLINWSVPSESGKYRLKGHLHLEYEPTEDYFGNPTYTCDMKRSKITDFEATPYGRADKEEEEKVESSTEVIEAGMTNEEVEDAILNSKPFDLESFKRFRGEDNEGEVTAEQIEVGDTFEVNSAEIVDYGTIVKVLGINEPEYKDDFFDFTFRCEVVEPASEKSSSKVGEEQILWYDADEYVGKIIPV